MEWMIAVQDTKENSLNSSIDKIRFRRSSRGYEEWKVILIITVENSSIRIISTFSDENERRNKIFFRFLLFYFQILLCKLVDRSWWRWQQCCYVYNPTEKGFFGIKLFLIYSEICEPTQQMLILIMLISLLGSACVIGWSAVLCNPHSKTIIVHEINVCVYVGNPFDSNRLALFLSIFVHRTDLKGFRGF